MVTSFSRQQGFTLIELLVVILIIAILIAVAAPSFLNQKDKAYNSSAQQTLSVVRKSAKAEWTSGQNQSQAYPASLAAALQDGEPQYKIEPFDSTNPSVGTNVQGTVYVDRLGDSSMIACQESASTTVFCVKTFEGSAVDVLTANLDNVAFAAGKTQTLRSSGANFVDAVAALSPSSGTTANKGTGQSGRPGWVGGKLTASTTVTPVDPAVAQAAAEQEARSALLQYIQGINDYVAANPEFNSRLSSSSASIYRSMAPSLDLQCIYDGCDPGGINPIFASEKAGKSTDANRVFVQNPDEHYLYYNPTQGTSFYRAYNIAPYHWILLRYDASSNPNATMVDTISMMGPNWSVVDMDFWQIS